MIKVERDRCAELVEQIRRLSLRLPENFDEADIDAVNDEREHVRELCDQLIMILQPITVRYPKRTP